VVEGLSTAQNAPGPLLGSAVQIPVQQLVVATVGVPGGPAHCPFNGVQDGVARGDALPGLTVVGLPAIGAEPVEALVAMQNAPHPFVSSA
jgi:hypothetical protein